MGKLLRKLIIIVVISAIGVVLLGAVLWATVTGYRYWTYSRGIENSHWSQQGEWITFTCLPDFVIYLVRPDGSELQQLTNEKIGAQQSVWSPDGNEIAFSATVGRENAIYRLKRGARWLTRVAPNEPPYFYFYPSFPAWSPDGQWIAFHIADLKLFRVETGEQISKAIIHGVNQGSLAWSPDSQWIAFYYYNAEPVGIYKIRLDGRDLRLVVSDAYSPAWSPDGRQIAFLRKHKQNYYKIGGGEQTDIFLVQADGNQIRQLTVSGGVADPDWSPDGQWIVFTQGTGRYAQLYKIKVDGSDFQRVTSINCNAMMPDWIKMPND